MPKTEVVKRLDRIQAVSRLRLKEIGFKVRGRTFNRTTSDGLVHVINIQKDKYDDKFAVNLGVHIPEVSLHMDQSPTGAWVQEYHCDIRERLGANGIDGDDMWWWIGLDTEAIGTQLSKNILANCVPYLDQFSTRHAVLEILSKDLDKRNFGGSRRLACAIIYCELGDLEAARQLIKEQYEAALKTHKAHAAFVQKLAERLGIQI